MLASGFRTLILMVGNAGHTIILRDLVQGIIYLDTNGFKHLEIELGFVKVGVLPAEVEKFVAGQPGEPAVGSAYTHWYTGLFGCKANLLNGKGVDDDVGFPQQFLERRPAA